MSIDGPEKDFILDDGHFSSKALLSATRAEAFIHSYVSSYFMPILHRAAPGATRMKPDISSSVGQNFVISLFDAASGDEAGRTYSYPDDGYYSAFWLSDVIRIERFAADTSAMKA